MPQNAVRSDATERSFCVRIFRVNTVQSQWQAKYIQSSRLKGYPGLSYFFFYKTCHEYSLKVPWWCTSIEYPLYIYSWRNKKKIFFFHWKDEPSGANSFHLEQTPFQMRIGMQEQTGSHESCIPCQKWSENRNIPSVFSPLNILCKTSISQNYETCW